MKIFLIYFLALFTVLSCSGRTTAQDSLDDYFHGGKKAPTLICGHRGGNDTGLPENSLTLFTALSESFDQQAVMIELDVRKSADGELYVLHDATLDRTTTGKDSIHQVGTAYLQQLRLTTTDGEVTEEKIPVFREVLNWLAGRENVFLMIDVKGDCWREVTEMIQEKKLTGRCLLLTFSLADTRQAYDLLPDAWISTLVKDASDDQQLRALSLPATRLVAYINSNTPKGLLKKLRRNGLLLTTDVSELGKSNPSPLPKRFYRSFARKNKLGILISDYPVRVKGFF